MCVCIAYTCRAGPGRAMRTGTVRTRRSPSLQWVGPVQTWCQFVQGGPVQNRPVHEQSVPGQLSPALKAAVISSEYFTRFYHLELLSFHLRISTQRIEKKYNLSSQRHETDAQTASKYLFLLLYRLTKFNSLWFLPNIHRFV